MPSRQKKAQKNTTSTIRIIGGEWRGRKLAVTPIEGLRPTGDRVRETLFNWLMPYVHGSRCLDLFAGSGALGLEALSRGSKFVQFAELNPQAAQQLDTNLATLECSAANVFRGNGLTLLTPALEPFDIIFLDPPFAQDLWHDALTQLVINGALHNHTLVYIEWPKARPMALPAGWHSHREKHAGDVRYALYQWRG